MKRECIARGNTECKRQWNNDMHETSSTKSRAVALILQHPKNIKMVKKKEEPCAASQNETPRHEKRKLTAIPNAQMSRRSFSDSEIGRPIL